MKDDMGMQSNAAGGGKGGHSRVSDGSYSGAKDRMSPGTTKGFQGGAAGELAKQSRSRPLDGAKNIGWK